MNKTVTRPAQSGISGTLDTIEDLRTERKHVQELGRAKQTYGKESARSGLVLIELEKLYESQGRFDEALETEKRIHSILREYSSKFGVGR